jgi:cytochrome d ubiquinol oxidase subunit II
MASALLYDRLQFAFTSTFHYLFPQLTMGLALLASTAWGSYPNLLIATNDPANSLTITNATAGAYGMQIGIWWFLIGFGLIIAYQVCAHRAFGGKVQL